MYGETSRLSGPFNCDRDKYIALIDAYLGLIQTGDLKGLSDPLRTYFTHLEIKELVEGDSSMRQPTEYFIKHEDCNFHNFLATSDGKFSGIIDWEW